MVFWNQSVRLHAVTLLLSVLFVELWRTAGVPLAHLFLHPLQALVQVVPLQQTSQLVLGKVPWMLRGSVEESVLVKRNRASTWVGMRAKKYLWRFLIHGPASFGKLLHVLEYLVFHFRGQAGKLLRIDVHWVGVSVRLSLKFKRKLYHIVVIQPEPHKRWCYAIWGCCSCACDHFTWYMWKSSTIPSHSFSSPSSTSSSSELQEQNTSKWLYQQYYRWNNHIKQGTVIF